MSDTPIKIEKRKRGFTMYSLIGMLVLGGVFFYIAGREMSQGTGSAFDLVLALVTLFITVLLAWGFFNEPTVYTLYDDRLVTDYFGRKPRTLLFADITSWDEQLTGSKGKERYSLELYTPTSKIVIPDTLECYYVIKNMATKGKGKATH